MKISVIVNGECNHYDAEYETREFDSYTYWADAATYVPDDSYSEDVLTCQKCREWLDKDGTWRDDGISK